MGAALAKAGLPPHCVSFSPGMRNSNGPMAVPCVVDRDGVSWLVEHDSHGQFLWGIREVIVKPAMSPFSN